MLLQVKERINMDYQPVQLPASFPAAVRETGQAAVQEQAPHFHNCVQLGFCQAGRGRLLVEERSFAFVAGDVALIPPYTLHAIGDMSVEQGERPSRWRTVYFDLEMIGTPFFNAYMPEMARRDAGLSSVLVHAVTDPLTSQLAMGILEEMDGEKRYYPEVVRGLTLALLLRLSRYAAQRPDRQSRRRGVLTIAPAIEWMQSKYSAKLSPLDMAALCHMSPTHFRRVFKASVGCPPLEYLNRLRIRKACALLSSTDEPVLEIAMSVGYESISSFNRFFMEYVGITPTAWRQEKGYPPPEGR